MRKSFWGIFLLNIFVVSFMLASYVSGQQEAEPVKESIIQMKKVDPPQSLEEVAVQQVETAKKLIDTVIEFFVKYSFQVIGGFIVLLLGYFIGGFISRKLFQFCQKKNFDVTVSKFIADCIKLLIILFAVIVALGKFGIEVAPLIAALSVAGFGLSFALQGPLANYAAGLSLIFAKPFKVGDIIEVADRTGEVLEIKLPRTEIRTVDGVKVLIPNSSIVGEIIHNCSKFKRVDLDVGVAYDADVDRAIELVRETIKSDKRVESSKEPCIGIKGFGDSSVDIHARFWCRQTEYWSVFYDLNKRIFDAFKQNNIEIPFPQRDVHLFKVDETNG